MFVTYRLCVSLKVKVKKHMKCLGLVQLGISSRVYQGVMLKCTHLILYLILMYEREKMRQNKLK
jgi:hypothetical protein